MNNEVDNDLDLLDLEDEETLDNAPAACSPFATPRPSRPWLLLGLGLLIIILATYIIIRAVGPSADNSVEIDLDVPAVEMADDTLVIPDTPAAVTPPPAPAAVAAVPVTPGVPVRTVADRNDTATFQPDAKPAPAPKPAAKPAAPKTEAKPAVAGGWYVQFGSYSTRALAEAAQKKITAGHSGLLGGKQFVILAAQINGKTMYRLRIAFKTQNDANMFCQNAKSDGLDCYVAK